MNAPIDILTRAEMFLEQRRLAQATCAFHRAESEGHDNDRCAAGRWMAAMLSGDFEAAWRESDSIRQRGTTDPNRFWLGEELIGKRIIIRCLHGFGDAVQFLRYAPLIRSIARQLIVECAPALVGLARCMPGIDAVITWGPDAPATPPAWDVQVEVMELPYIFRTTLASLPPATCLQLPTADLRTAAEALRTWLRPSIGVVWNSGEWDPSRSVRLDTLRPLLDRGDFEFWNLQGGPVRGDWTELVLQANLHDHAMLNDAGLVPLAAFVAQLDLVITVDTLAAHLAGVLNIPCFLMLQHAADWRWMVDRSDSPWYPSLRLFRQPLPGDWTAVVHQLGDALETWINRYTRKRSVA